MKILALIPARMGSSRFPGKPVAKILSKPMIGHVYENVKKCDPVFRRLQTSSNKLYSACVVIFNYSKEKSRVVS